MGYRMCLAYLKYPKYAFPGALRSAAQMVSYEVSIGLIIIDYRAIAAGWTLFPPIVFPIPHAYVPEWMQLVKTHVSNSDPHAAIEELE